MVDARFLASGGSAGVPLQEAWWPVRLDLQRDGMLGMKRVDLVGAQARALVAAGDGARRGGVRGGRGKETVGSLRGSVLNDQRATPGRYCWEGPRTRLRPRTERHEGHSGSLLKYVRTRFLATRAPAAAFGRKQQ